ncbi:neuromedin-U receptor 2-like [Actinia tenebrosa]|uniref:Neuromedin-U receptor 2-like n=1 Tax=Actinia tenebrosa TaxID=6105 RepID=A0A6P8IL57_ACTTE|nr:neuromedin-U receptor 2-like [Actinia tenebrosa]
MHENDKLEVVKLVLTSAIVLPNFLGNFLVCLVVLRNRFFQTYINFLLVHLSVTDIFAGMFALLEAVLDITMEDKSFLHPILCKIVFNQHFVYIGVNSSYSTIIFISVVRYLFIAKPFKSVKFRSTKNLKYVIPVIWAVSLLSLSPRIYADFAMPGCSKLVVLPMTSKIGGGISIVFRGILLPVTTLSYTYWKIKKALNARQNIICNTITSSRQQAALNSKKKTTRLLGFIIIAFVLCSVPHYCYAVARSIFSYHHLASHVYVDCLLFGIFIASSSVNPFLYWFHCKRFRKAALWYLGNNRIAPQ